MRIVQDRRLALLFSLLAALLTGLPYIIAAELAPEGTTFTGFLINPVDGFSYLAKMRQGSDGFLTLVLPYAPEPGPRTLLYIYYLLLGQAARIFSLEPIIALHLARIAAAALAFYCAYRLLEFLCVHRHVRWFAFGLIVFGSGLGWLSVISGSLESADILIPESVPFLAAYSNAHFPIALAALLCCVAAALADHWSFGLRVAASVAGGLVIGAVLPFSFVSLAALLGIWLALEVWIAWRRRPIQANGSRLVKTGIVLMASSLGAGPWIAYDLWLSRSHPVISEWNLQNQTLSPPPIAYLLGFAPLILMGLIGVVRSKPWRSQVGRLVLVWVVSGALLLYAPLSFQRRLSLGLAVPLSVLAAWGWGAISIKAKLRRIIAVLLIIIFSITNILVIVAGVAGVISGEAAVVYRSDELESYRWVRENIPAKSLVLTGEQVGNRLPAYADVRILYGHPFETPMAVANLALLDRLYRDPESHIGDLRRLGISWVYLGEDEVELGDPAWAGQLTLRWRSGAISIYEVPPA